MCPYRRICAEFEIKESLLTLSRSFILFNAEISTFIFHTSKFQLSLDFFSTLSPYLEISDPYTLDFHLTSCIFSDFGYTFIVSATRLPQNPQTFYNSLNSSCSLSLFSHTHTFTHALSYSHLSYF